MKDNTPPVKSNYIRSHIRIRTQTLFSTLTCSYLHSHPHLSWHSLSLTCFVVALTIVLALSLSLLQLAICPFPCCNPWFCHCMCQLYLMSGSFLFLFLFSNQPDLVLPLEPALVFAVFAQFPEPECVRCFDWFWVYGLCLLALLCSALPGANFPWITVQPVLWSTKLLLEAMLRWQFVRSERQARQVAWLTHVCASISRLMVWFPTFGSTHTKMATWPGVNLRGQLCRAWFGAVLSWLSECCCTWLRICSTLPRSPEYAALLATHARKQMARPYPWVFPRCSGSHGLRGTSCPRAGCLLTRASV